MDVIQIMNLGPCRMFTAGEWLSNHPVTAEIIDKAKKLDALNNLALKLVNTEASGICSGWTDTNVAAQSGRGTSWAMKVLPFRKLDRLTVYAALLNGRPADEDVELLKRRIQVVLAESEVESIRSILLFICSKAGEFGPSAAAGSHNIKSVHSITRTTLRKHGRRSS